jgi:3'-phosphoadenosine 5'-phosphosulfate sulfotransferase (PAPS reductase)/FAD synthetase
MRIELEELKFRQALPLEQKIEMSQCVIETWWKHWDENVYVAFSGGRDSTVLLDVIRKLFPDIPAVFCDTGLEYPEIKEFVRTIDNVIIERPKLSFRQVIDKYGYPIISKEQSRYLFDIQTSHSDKLKNIRIFGNKWNRGKISKKWLFLIDAPFKISQKCCDKLKKFPAIQYEKRTGRKPYLGTLVDESSMRKETYLRYGCNAFDTNRPISSPLSFWTKKDILEYITKFNVPYSKIYDMGYERTGCMFCMYGVNREKEPNKFQLMKQTHNKLYNYCINDLGCGEVMDYIGVNYT